MDNFYFIWNLDRIAHFAVGGGNILERITYYLDKLFFWKKEGKIIFFIRVELRRQYIVSFFSQLSD